MFKFLLIYVVLGIIGAVLTLRMNKKYRVESSLVDILELGLLLAIYLASWPIWVIWDMLEIPKKRKEKYEKLKTEQTRKRMARKLARKQKQEYEAIYGKYGVTLTPLSVVGKVDIGGTVWDALSMDGYIERGEKIVFVSRTGAELKVQRRAQLS